MATLHHDENVLVLRVVFDGPAEAGKTTTLKALGQTLSRACISPGTAGDRTLFFDWVYYRGGSFEGRQIDCQVVSVPGQATLRHRRNLLLHAADVVIYVSPSAQQSVDETIEALDRLNRECGRQIGIVCQVNQRDRDGAYDLTELRQRLEGVGPNIAVVETVASEGTGVREAFVLAVRLALDRVKELARNGSLPEGPPPETEPGELMARLLEREAIVKFDAGQFVERRTQPGKQPASGRVRVKARADTTPTIPSTDVDSVCIWPPIEGRVALTDATSETPTLARVDDGWWSTTTNGWLFYSADAAHFSDWRKGKKQLQHLAKQHLRYRSLLSFPRCIMLQRESDGSCRLWEVLRERLSMRARLTTLFDESDHEKVARVLVDTAHRLIELEAQLSGIEGAQLHATLDTTGVFSGQTRYVGLLSNQQAHAATYVSALTQMRSFVRDWNWKKEQLLDALDSVSLRVPKRQDAAEHVRRVLLEEAS